MSVRIRMKQMGRTHRHFYRIVATDTKNPRDGRIIEELGTYDPSVPETDARVKLNQERLAYWLSVGALPSEHVAIFIKKYGPNGTHAEAQKAALEKIRGGKKASASLTAPTFIKKTRAEQAAEAAAAAQEAAAAEAAANGAVSEEAAATDAAAPSEPAAS
ncbi:MAG: 30S ribosomal protein S16 [Pirellulales bacterium]